MSLAEARALAETNITPGQLLDVLANLGRYLIFSSQPALHEHMKPTFIWSMPHLCISGFPQNLL